MRKKEAAQMAAHAERQGWDFVRFEIRERPIRGYDYAIVIRDPKTGRAIKIKKPGHLASLRKDGNDNVPHLL